MMRWLPIGQAAAMLGVSTDTIRRRAPDDVLTVKVGTHKQWSGESLAWWWDHRGKIERGEVDVALASDLDVIRCYWAEHYAGQEVA